MRVKPARVRSIEESREARNLRFQKHGIVMRDIQTQFTTVTIREYPVTIGDNPASQSGPALTIEWDYATEATIALADYENQRPPRRRGGEMVIPAYMREDLLRAAGFSRADIVRLTRRVNITRAQRRQTYNTLHLQPIQAWSEKVARITWNLITLGKYKLKERKFLERYVGNNKQDEGLPSESVDAMRRVTASTVLTVTSIGNYNPFQKQQVEISEAAPLQKV